MGRDLYASSISKTAPDIISGRPAALTSIPIAGTAGLAYAGVVTDTVTVDVAGTESVGAGCTLPGAGAWGEGLILADLQLARYELVQAAGQSAGGEKGGCGETERMHFCLRSSEREWKRVAADKTRNRMCAGKLKLVIHVATDFTKRKFEIQIRRGLYTSRRSFGEARLQKGEIYIASTNGRIAM